MRLFTADFSTAQYSQWGYIENSGPNHRNTGIYAVNASDHPTGTGDYSLTITPTDRDCGWAGRFELREADDYEADGQTKQRNELNSYPAYTDTVGDARWIGFSLRFDQDFLTNPGAYSWLSLAQYHTTVPGPPATMWCFTPNGTGTPTDHFSLLVGSTFLCHVPMRRGNWIDIKMHAKWSRGDDGFIKVWVNNEPLTLLTGGDTFTGPNLNPTLGSDQVRYKIGMYRDQASVWPAAGKTMAMQWQNFRVADTEASL